MGQDQPCWGLEGVKETSTTEEDTGQAEGRDLCSTMNDGLGSEKNDGVGRGKGRGGAGRFPCPGPSAVISAGPEQAQAGPSGGDSCTPSTRVCSLEPWHRSPQNSPESLGCSTRGRCCLLPELRAMRKSSGGVLALRRVHQWWSGSWALNPTCRNSPDGHTGTRGAKKPTQDTKCHSSIVRTEAKGLTQSKGCI